MKIKYVSLLASTLLLAGCTSFTPQPIDPGQQQVRLESRRLDAPEVREFIEHSLGHNLSLWPPQAWDLESLTFAAFTFHPDIDLVLAQRLAAEAAIETAGAQPNPTGSISPLRSGGIGFDIPIQTAGKRTYKIDQARHLADAAKLREANGVWQIRSQVRSNLLLSYPTETYVLRQYNLQKEITQIIENRFILGYVSQSERTQAQLALNQTLMALNENQRQHAQNLIHLATAVGVQNTALQGVEFSYNAFNKLPPLSSLPVTEMRRKALLTRPDVLAALAEYEATQSALQLEVAKQYPDLSIGTGYSWDTQQTQWSLSLNLTLPLFNQNQGPIAEAKARREEAAAIFLSVQAKATGEIDEAITRYIHAIQTYETASILLQTQIKKEHSIEAAFRAGELDRLTWLSARYETAVTDLVHINTWIEAQQSLGLLEDALRQSLNTQQIHIITAEQVMSEKLHQNGKQP